MLLNKIKGFKNFWKFAIFCFVGAMSVMVDLIFFNLFFFMGINFILCRIFAMFFSITFNFIMNRNLTFSARGICLNRQIGKYVIVYSAAIAVNLLVSFIVFSAVDGGTLGANISSIAGICASIPISFLGSLLWTFRKKIN